MTGKKEYMTWLDPAYTLPNQIFEVHGIYFHFHCRQF